MISLVQYLPYDNPQQHLQIGYFLISLKHFHVAWCDGSFHMCANIICNMLIVQLEPLLAPKFCVLLLMYFRVDHHHGPEEDSHHLIINNIIFYLIILFMDTTHRDIEASILIIVI